MHMHDFTYFFMHAGSNQRVGLRFDPGKQPEKRFATLRIEGLH